MVSRIQKEVKAIYIDTTQALPECNEYVKDLCNDWGVNLTIVKRRDADFWSLVKRWGFPHVRFRWCMREVKTVPLKLFNEHSGGDFLHLTGTNIGKSSVRGRVYGIRGNHYFNRNIGAYVFHPILSWDEQMANEYIEKHDILVNPCYSTYGQGGNCYYCPFVKSKEYYLKLSKIHPELFSNIVAAEKGMRNKGAAIYLGNGKLLHISKLV